jgi:hypothetical protein
MTKILKAIESTLIVTIVFLISFLGNVYFHEIGHFVAADSMGLNPKINIEPLENSLKFTTQSQALAYTEFDKTETKSQMFFIAIMGPLVNLLLIIIFFMIYTHYAHNPRIQIVALAGLIPSIFSFIVNIIPFGVTDGMIILTQIL